MSDQEMLDAIDAEIEAVRVANTRIRLNGPGASETIRAHIAYVNGLRFARMLVVKRMDHRLNTRQGAYLDAGGAE